MSKHPFERLEQGYHERAAARAETAYEESRVSYVLSKLFPNDAAKTARELRKADIYFGGQGMLTFRAFNETYSTFPVLLTTSCLKGVKLHLDSRMMLPELFKNPGAAPFMKPYEHFYEWAHPRARGRAVGLVVRFKGIPSGLLIYNDGLETLPWARGSFWCCRGGTKKHPHHIYLATFQALIEAVKASRCV